MYLKTFNHHTRPNPCNVINIRMLKRIIQEMAQHFRDSPIIMARQSLVYYNNYQPEEINSMTNYFAPLSSYHIKLISFVYV